MSKYPNTFLVNNEIEEIFVSIFKTVNGRELIDTLAYYFKCNDNVNETSKQLHIHRNTTNYRLNKISEVFKLDIHKLNDIFELYTNYLNFKKKQYESKTQD
ncbi:PucR family transcriptional regulator [Companilactobacillus zhongbaensis]|uniref:PucR family transcriptional regulator n=1 Tax=Companilactobacillus zhongbaensis TaxID=2486009 RepID=UPI000F76D78A|nr:helix-turn-helix domain-containing protein [Companilactobacillus zhongbaensis]